jgi:S-adenosylmethionine hydrolase
MIITLTTDFGLRDAFVGTMKGVILEIAPAVQIVDLTHEVPRGDIRSGAFALMTAASFFPAGTIHVAVIDPGVGSARKALALSTPEAIFIGPDNGVLSWAVRPENVLEIRSIENSAFFLPRMSSTFQGRDLFAPAAAHLMAKRKFSELGPELGGFQRIRWPQPMRLDEGWRTEIIHVDVYGNAITSLPIEPTAALKSVVLAGNVRIPFARFYGAVAPGTPVAVAGSSGFLEIAVNQGHVADQLSLRVGSEVVVY